MLNANDRARAPTASSYLTRVIKLGGVWPAAGSCLSWWPAGVWGIAELRGGYRYAR